MSSQRLEEGTLLGGRYEILEIVGRGGMGTVYRARDTRLDTIVAVKEMTEREVTAEEREASMRQFAREARMLGQLKHSNLPSVTDYFIDNERCYLIMEFVTGMTLEARIRQTEGPLPLPNVLEWAVQLADVLAYLHGQAPPIVFRDLKPANVMLTPEGMVKLIDFGIARRFQANATKDTLLYGSPGYSPPEQYGRTQTNPRSDIYALGATLHHLATGRDPAPTPFRFPSARSINPDVPLDFDEFLQRCVQMDEDRRCQTAEEARDTLARIRYEVMNTARPAPGPVAGTAHPGPRVITSHPRPQPRKRQLVLGAGIATAFIALAVIGLLARNHKSHAVPAQPPAPTAQPAPGNAAQGVGTLNISSTPPGAVAVVDGQQIGPTPQTLDQISAGKHTIRLIPPDGSGLAEAYRDVLVQPGRTLEVITTLAPIPEMPPQTPAGPTADIQPPSAQMVGGEVRVHFAFRLSGAAGKTGVVSVFFFEPDGRTPLRPPGPPGGPFRNPDGQLSVSNTFRADNDPADFPEVTLTIPRGVFPPMPGVPGYQVVVYVDGKPAGQTDIRPMAGG